MKIVSILFLIITTTFCFAEEQKDKMFINEKYGYSFLYPDYLEVRLTGKKKERDGRCISIYRYEYAAPTPSLQIQISPKQLPENDELLKVKESKKFLIKNRNIIINRERIAIYELIFKKNNRIFMTQLYLNGVKFVYTSSPSGEKFDEIDWFEIITTFKMNKIYVKTNLLSVQK